MKLDGESWMNTLANPQERTDNQFKKNIWQSKIAENFTIYFRVCNRAQIQNTSEFSKPELIWDSLYNSPNMCCSQFSHCSACFWEQSTLSTLSQRWNRPSVLRCKCQHLSWLRVNESLWHWWLAYTYVGSRWCFRETFLGMSVHEFCLLFKI